MKKAIAMLLLLIPLAMPGCATRTGSAVGGAIGGAAAGGGSYEYRIRQELQRLEDDYKAGRMDQKEYEIRKDEIQRLQLIK
ncbi:MAG: hypothetical protein A2010_18235 [Nitrospirae bacterium GWD2_57_9]|nr:MAG: hypothetical protein A2010_18235 [Nitrospirae bacterium GWD2_57_9]OGW48186.1 MAG: hypothetical protein A2078_04740 [Nitrospirae bacterium GWC2_57_9]